MKQIFLLFVISVTCCSTTYLQHDTVHFNETKNMRGIITRHNYWRAKVSAPPLKWSYTLSLRAKKWANHLRRENCRVYHSPGNRFGENIYWSVRMTNTPESVVDAWAEEIQYFDTKTGKCKGGECGHYTQIIWKNTTKVGCATVQCGDKEIWVCEYSPAGNWVGQKPY